MRGCAREKPRLHHEYNGILKDPRRGGTGELRRSFKGSAREDIERKRHGDPKRKQLQIKLPQRTRALLDIFKGVLKRSIAGGTLVYVPIEEGSESRFLLSVFQSSSRSYRGISVAKLCEGRKPNLLEFGRDDLGRFLHSQGSVGPALRRAR